MLYSMSLVTELLHGSLEFRYGIPVRLSQIYLQSPLLEKCTFNILFW